MPELNVPLLLSTLDHIERHPARWNQRFFQDCGSGCCFAGWAVALHEGHRPYTDNQAVRLGKNGHEQFEIQIDLLAQEYLGLTFHESSVLFDPNNNMEEIRNFISRMVRRRG